MSEKIKNMLWKVFAVVLVVVAVFWFLSSDLEHIADTNGPDDRSLQTITPQQIVDMSTGSIGGPNITRMNFPSNTVKISSKKFTGVYEILYDNFIGKSDFTLDLIDFKVTEGNCQLVVVHDDEIVAYLDPGMEVAYRLDDIKGHVALRIVGESAAFRFEMTPIDYDFHSHHE